LENDDNHVMQICSCTLHRDHV